MVNLSFYYERKTKMKINIIPLEKIEIDGKSIELGMKREQVIGILGLGKLMTAKMENIDIGNDKEENFSGIKTK